MNPAWILTWKTVLSSMGSTAFGVLEKKTLTVHGGISEDFFSYTSNSIDCLIISCHPWFCFFSNTTITNVRTAASASQSEMGRYLFLLLFPLFFISTTTFIWSQMLTVIPWPHRMHSTWEICASHLLAEPWCMTESSLVNLIIFRRIARLFSPAITETPSKDRHQHGCSAINNKRSPVNCWISPRVSRCYRKKKYAKGTGTETTVLRKVKNTTVTNTWNTAQLKVFENVLVKAQVVGVLGVLYAELGV